MIAEQQRTIALTKQLDTPSQIIQVYFYQNMSIYQKLFQTEELGTVNIPTVISNRGTWNFSFYYNSRIEFDTLLSEMLRYI